MAQLKPAKNSYMVINSSQHLPVQTHSLSQVCQMESQISCNNICVKLRTFKIEDGINQTGIRFQE